MTIIAYPGQTITLAGQGFFDLWAIAFAANANATKVSYRVNNWEEASGADLTWRIPKLYKAGTIQFANSSSVGDAYPVHSQFIRYQNETVGFFSYDVNVPLALDVEGVTSRKSILNANTTQETAVLGVTSGSIDGNYGGPVTGVEPTYAATGGFQSTFIGLDGVVNIPPTNIDGGLTFVDGTFTVPDIVSEFLALHKGVARYIHFKIPPELSVSLLTEAWTFASNDDL